ncbi:MAG: diadenylate cyclase [Pirellulaceae bacterium]|jgi:diadenylate cyclase|nr:diadenylate cyclase [Pirellulaceae bacterium]
MPQFSTKHELLAFIDSAVNLAESMTSGHVLLLLEYDTDWGPVLDHASGKQILVATHLKTVIARATASNIPVIELERTDTTIHDQLTQAILEAVANEWIEPGARVVAVYSGFDEETVDSISLIELNERLGKLTARDLKKLDTTVPLETLKLVVDLAVEIGREGREGKPVGTMFVVGDHRKVLEESQPAGFDFVKGYPRRERSLADPRVRENIKEIAQLDGMFVVASDGTVEATCRIIDTNPVELTMTTGLGSRHYAGAAISKNTKAIAVVVSTSSGTVRLFQNGETVLRIEPLRRAMIWRNFGSDSGGES